MQIQKKDLQPLRWFLAVFFVVFVGQTYSRVEEWSDTGVMLTVAVNDHPKSSRARTEYANYLYSQGRSDETLEQLKISAELDPHSAGPVLHQLVVRCLQEKDQGDLLAEARTRLSTWPASAYTLSAINKLMSSIIRRECKQVSMRDLELLLLAGLSQPGNLEQAINHGTFLGFTGLLNMLSGNYEKGAELFLEDYKLSGNILVLSQLARYQIQFRQYDDAEQTIASIEEINKAHFGIETYTVVQLSKALADARKKIIPAEPDVGP
jgi:tetratricopeptide (TPR) repeat protein